MNAVVTTLLSHVGALEALEQVIAIDQARELLDRNLSHIDMRNPAIHVEENDALGARWKMRFARGEGIGRRLLDPAVGRTPHQRMQGEPAKS